MKIQSILMGQALRSIRASNAGNVYLLDAVKGLKDRYGFIQFPTTLQEYDASKGVTFLHGKFTSQRPLTTTGLVSQNLVIDRFQIYTNGVLAETKAFAEDADLFLDDVLEWAKERFGLVFNEIPPIRKAYLSQLEVVLNINLNNYSRDISPFSKRIEDFLEGYGQKESSFEVSNISLHCDTTQFPVLAPTAFIVERKVQTPYSSQTYVTSAPLKTADHIKILESLERRPRKK